MGKPSSQTTAPKPAIVSTRKHNRKPLMELLAVKLETSLETFAQLAHFAKGCEPSADVKFKPILQQLASAADSLSTATKTTLANYVKLVDGKFTPPVSVRPVRPSGLSIGDWVTIVPEFAPRYEAFTPWKGCSKEKLQIVHAEGSEYLAKRPNGSDLLIRSSKHLAATTPPPAPAVAG